MRNIAFSPRRRIGRHGILCLPNWLWNVWAAYHNLPMIGEDEQQPGREYAARDVRFLPDGLSLDMAGAYGQDAGLLRLQRKVRLNENGLTVQDSVQLEEKKPVTWVFMLWHQPDFVSGGFLSGAIRAEYPAALQAEAEEIPIQDPRMARNFPGSLWRVKLTSPAERTFDVAFVFLWGRRIITKIDANRLTIVTKREE